MLWNFVKLTFLLKLLKVLSNLDKQARVISRYLVTLYDRYRATRYLIRDCEAIERRLYKLYKSGRKYSNRWKIVHALNYQQFHRNFIEFIGLILKYEAQVSFFQRKTFLHQKFKCFWEHKKICLTFQFGTFLI